MLVRSSVIQEGKILTGLEDPIKFNGVLLERNFQQRFMQYISAQVAIPENLLAFI